MSRRNDLLKQLLASDKFGEEKENELIEVQMLLDADLEKGQEKQ